MHRRMPESARGAAHQSRTTAQGDRQMLAFNVFGTKEIIAYVVVVIVLIIIGWYLMRGRSRA